MKVVGVLLLVVVILWCVYSIAKFVISIIKHSKEKKEITQEEKECNLDTFGTTLNSAEVNIKEEE